MNFFSNEFKADALTMPFALVLRYLTNQSRRGHEVLHDAAMRIFTYSSHSYLTKTPKNSGHLLSRDILKCSGNSLALVEESHLDTAAELPVELLECSMKCSRIRPWCSILIG